MTPYCFQMCTCVQRAETMLRTWEAMLAEARRETHSRLQQRVQLQRQLIRKMNEYQALKQSAMLKEEREVRQTQCMCVCSTLHTVLSLVEEGGGRKCKERSLNMPESSSESNWQVCTVQPL